MVLDFGARFSCRGFLELDDGWPESVEEQFLLVLISRQYITRQYIKDVSYSGEKNGIKTIYYETTYKGCMKFI